MRKHSSFAVKSLILIIVVSMIVFAYLRIADRIFSIDGKVIRVVDGDSITILEHGNLTKIRLFGVDCPEMGQAFGRKAKQLTKTLTFKKNVTIKTHGKDKYDRTLGVVVLPDGRELGQELVKAGLAWHYKKYSSDRTLAKLERQAKETKAGLWADPQSIPPWQWRVENR